MKTPESVLSAKALHRAWMDLKIDRNYELAKMYLLRCGRDEDKEKSKIEPPADFANFLMNTKEVGETVVDIGGGSISAKIKQEGKIVKGETDQEEETSNDLYQRKLTPKQMAGKLLKHIASLENKKQKKLKDLGMELSKTEVMQTGKMRKDFYSPKARRGIVCDLHPCDLCACDQCVIFVQEATTTMLTMAMMRTMRDMERTAKNMMATTKVLNLCILCAHSHCVLYTEYADYAMYEEALGNLNRAQMEYDLALELLERKQIERSRPRRRVSRYYD